MKVILLTDKNLMGAPGWQPPSGGPQVGKEYTVVAECIGYTRIGTEVKCFRLAEFPPNELYFQGNFAILPDATAEEMEEEVSETIIA